MQSSFIDWIGYNSLIIITIYSKFMAHTSNIVFGSNTMEFYFMNR